MVTLTHYVGLFAPGFSVMDVFAALPARVVQ